MKTISCPRCFRSRTSTWIGSPRLSRSEIKRMKGSMGSRVLLPKLLLISLEVVPNLPRNSNHKEVQMANLRHDSNHKLLTTKILRTKRTSLETTKSVKFLKTLNSSSWASSTRTRREMWNLVTSATPSSVLSCSSLCNPRWRNPIERSTIEELLKRSHGLSSAHTKAVKRYTAAKDHSTYTSRSSITGATRQTGKS